MLLKANYTSLAALRNIEPPAWTAPPLLATPVVAAIDTDRDGDAPARAMAFVLPLAGII